MIALFDAFLSLIERVGRKGQRVEINLSSVFVWLDVTFSFPINLIDFWVEIKTILFFSITTFPAIEQSTCQ